MTPKLENKAFSEKSTQHIGMPRIDKLIEYPTWIGTRLHLPSPIIVYFIGIAWGGVLLWMVENSLPPDYKLVMSIH